MYHNPLLALSGAVVLTAALVFVFADGPIESAEVVPPPPAALLEPPTTFAIAMSEEAPASQELARAEETLNLRVLLRSSTTTATTTTTTPPATPPTTSGSGSGSGSGTSPTTTAPSPPTTIKAEFRSDYEADFLGRINSLRSANGVPALTSNGSLKNRARDWARSMAAAGKLMHSTISDLVPPWGAAAENVGKGGSVGSVFGAFSGSGGHRSNMLGNYTNVGIGVWIDSQGTIWTVHIFTR